MAVDGNAILGLGFLGWLLGVLGVLLLDLLLDLLLCLLNRCVDRGHVDFAFGLFEELIPVLLLGSFLEFPRVGVCFPVQGVGVDELHGGAEEELVVVGWVEVVGSDGAREIEGRQRYTKERVC